MNASSRKSAEVKQIREKITKLVGCGTCALGIALDIVGQRWGEAPFHNWPCGSAECKAWQPGLTPEQTAALKTIAAELTGEVDLSSDVAPAPAQEPDTRLPPEKDDDERIPF
jgi:hypothetical protein